MIKKLLDTFTTLTRSFEVLAVIEGQKPACRLAVKEDMLPDMNTFCKEHKLAVAESDFKVKMQFEVCYSTKGTVMPRDSREKGHVFVYIAKDQNTADEAKLYEQKQDIREFGRILGYPGCCINFFIKNKPEEEKKQNDYVVPALKNSGGYRFPFYTNIFGRYFDVTLLDHSPCAFDCKPSIELGKGRLEMIRKHDAMIAEKFESSLKSVAVYSPKSVALLMYTKTERDVIHYSRIFETRKSLVSAVLGAADQIRVIDRNRFLVGENEFSVPLLIFD